MNRASLSYDPVIRDFHYPERRGFAMASEGDFVF